MSKTGPDFELSYQTHGGGAPILCIHGFGGNMHTWGGLIPRLSANHKLYLIDLKGFGDSPKPFDRNYSIKDHAKLIHRFILRHDFRDFTLMGHSFGGAVALFTALELLKEDEKRLASLVLINSVAYPQKLPTFMRLLRTPLVGRLGLMLIPASRNTRRVLRLGYYDRSKITDELISVYSGPLGTAGGKHALIQTARQILPPDLDETALGYETISVPTLVLLGGKDRIVPYEVGLRLSRTIGNARLAVIEKCGHNLPEECPEEASDVILKFLDELRRG